MLKQIAAGNDGDSFLLTAKYNQVCCKGPGMTCSGDGKNT